MPRARKRLHGKRRMRSALKQRMSDVSSNDNPYASSNSVQFSPELKSSISEFNKNYKPSKSKEAKEVRQLQASTKNKNDEDKLINIGKESLKKKVVKETAKKLGVKGGVQSLGGKMLGVGGLMFDALPAGEGSTLYEYKDMKKYYASGPNKGKPVLDENFKKIDYGV